jgi:hypothetical protein
LVLCRQQVSAFCRVASLRELELALGTEEDMPGEHIQVELTAIGCLGGAEALARNSASCPARIDFD